MKKITKLITLIMAMTMLVMSAAGCSAKPKEPTTDKTMGEMMDAVVGDYEVATMEATEEDFTLKYHLDMAKVEEAKIIYAMMMVHSDEIALVKAKTIEDVESIKASMEKREKESEETWKQYLPDQYEKVQNHKIVSQGKYVLYVVHEDAESVVKTFESFFTK